MSLEFIADMLVMAVPIAIWAGVATLWEVLAAARRRRENRRAERKVSR